MNIEIAKAIADHAAAILKGYESLEALKRLLVDDDVTIRGPDAMDTLHNLTDELGLEFKHSEDFSDEKWDKGSVTVKRPKYEFNKIPSIDEEIAQHKRIYGADDPFMCGPSHLGVYLQNIHFKIMNDVDLSTKEAIAWDKHLESLKDKPSTEEIEADVGPKDYCFHTMCVRDVLNLVIRGAGTTEEIEALKEYVATHQDEIEMDRDIEVREHEGEG